MDQPAGVALTAVIRGGRDGADTDTALRQTETIAVQNQG